MGRAGERPDALYSILDILGSCADLRNLRLVDSPIPI
jgi:hypothetical protein